MKVISMLTLMKVMNKGFLDIRLILNLPFTFQRSRELRLLFAVICPSFFPKRRVACFDIFRKEVYSVLSCETTLSLTSALDAAWWSTPHPYRFTPREKVPVSIIQEAGWAPRSFCTGAENLTPHRGSILGPSNPQRVAVIPHNSHSTLNS